MEKELVIVLDFGGQYNQLIARRVRECNVYCEVHPYTIRPEKIKELIARGEFVMKELEALYFLRKYRAMKQRYYSDTKV